MAQPSIPSARLHLGPRIAGAQLDREEMTAALAAGWGRPPDLSEISAVVNGVAGGKAASWGNSSQSVTGMVNVTPPGSPAVSSSPNR